MHDIDRSTRRVVYFAISGAAAGGACRGAAYRCRQWNFLENCSRSSWTDAGPPTDGVFIVVVTERAAATSRTAGWGWCGLVSRYACSVYTQCIRLLNTVQHVRVDRNVSVIDLETAVTIAL